MTTLTIDFFHDVVCCWCFNISSRMRALAAEFDLDIRHRSFVLQASPAEIAARWGTPKQAREAILGHWAACRQVSDQPDGIDIDAMRKAPFDYPHGMTGALGCKAAERLGGQSAHWDMFDRLQRAHLTEARNVADPETVLQIALELGFEPTAFAEVFDDPATARAVEADRQHARALQVRTIPALIVRETGARLVNGPREDLAAQLRAQIRLANAFRKEVSMFSKLTSILRKRTRRRIPRGVPRDLSPHMMRDIGLDPWPERPRPPFPPLW